MVEEEEGEICRARSSSFSEDAQSSLSLITLFFFLILPLPLLPASAIFELPFNFTLIIHKHVFQCSRFRHFCENSVHRTSGYLQATIY